MSYLQTITEFGDLLLDVVDTDRDAVVAITGDPGEGKSVFEQQLAKRVDTQYNPARNLVFDRDEFNELSDKMHRKGFIGADEAVGLFYARDYHDDEQIALLKKMDRIRDRGLVFAFLIPNLFHLDKHIRDSRVRFWVFVDQRKGKGENGEAHCYIFQREKNPFNPDPWNLTDNAKLWRKGKVSRSPNYLGEIIFKDLRAAEYAIYKEVKAIKRKIAERKEWQKAQAQKRRKGKTGEKFDKAVLNV